MINKNRGFGAAVITMLYLVVGVLTVDRIPILFPSDPVHFLYGFVMGGVALGSSIGFLLKVGNSKEELK